MSKFIDNLKQLQPQELEETRAMLDSDEDFANQFKSELDQLDAADYEVAQSMIMGRPADADVIPQGQQVANARDVEEDTSLGSKIQSGIQGFVQAIPFSDEVQAAAGVAADLATGNASLDNINESYEENMSFIKGYDKNMKDSNPTSYTGGRVVGEVSTSVLAGAKAVKVLGAVSKTGIVATHLGSDVALETARELGQKERVTYETFLESAGTASMYAGLGLGIGAGVSKGITAIGKYASKVPAEVYKKTLMTRGNAKMAKNVQDFLSNQKLHMGDPVSEKDYIGAMENLSGYQDLIKKGDFEGAQLLLKDAGSNAKMTKEGVVRHLEQKFPEDFRVGAKEIEMLDYGIFDEIQTTMEKYSGADASVLRNLQKAKDRVSKALSSGRNPETGEYVFDSLNYTQLQTALDSLQSLKKLKIGEFDGSKILGKIRNTKNSLHSLVPKGAEEADISMLSALPEMNKNIQVYKHAGNVKDAVLSEMTDMTEKGIMGRALQSASNYYRKHSAGSGMFGYAVTGPLAGTAGLAKSLLLDPQTIGKIQGIETMPVLKNTMNKLDEVGNFFAYGSGAKSPYAGTLMQRMFTSIHEGEDEKAQMHFSALESTQRLLKKPLERTTASFMQNKTDILNIVRAEAPDLLDDLEDTLANKGDIGPIMSELAKTSAGMELIGQGIGWEGKVYSEQDKAQLEAELVNNIFIPGDYKVQMVKALREGGVIPDMEGVPKRQPRRYELKAKRRPY